MTRRTAGSSGRPPRSGLQATRTARRRCAGERRAERGRVRRLAAGIAAVGAGHHAQQEGDVVGRPAQRAVDAEAEARERIGRGRHQADAGPQRDHVVEVRRVAQRAAEVAAVGDRQHAGGQRGARAAAGSAGAGAQVVGVARRAPDRVVGVGAEAELRHVGLADGERAGAPQALDDDGVGLADGVAIDGRAARERQARGFLQVLERDREAVQRAQRLAAGGARRRPGAPGRGTSSGGSIPTIALTWGFHCSIRARCASITSSADTCRPRTSAARARALRSQRSDIERTRIHDSQFTSQQAGTAVPICLCELSIVNCASSRVTLLARCAGWRRRWASRSPRRAGHRVPAGRRESAAAAARAATRAAAPPCSR